MATKAQIEKLLREEYNKLVLEAKEKAPKIEETLEKFRAKLQKEGQMSGMARFANIGESTVGTGTDGARRIALKTVSELLDIPINELMLYFKNEVSTKNERSLVEYHLGECYFYPKPE